MADQATFRIWRGDNGNGKFVDYTTEISSGMVVLDAVHSIQQKQANDIAVRWNCAAHAVIGQQPIHPMVTTAGVTPAIARRLDLPEAGTPRRPAPGPVVRVQTGSPADGRPPPACSRHPRSTIRSPTRSARWPRRARPTAG